MSRIQLLTSKISRICQEIRDIKSRRRPQTNIAIRNYTNTGLVEEQTSPNYTREQGSNSSAKEDTSDGGDWGGTYSSHSTLCPHEPSNHNNPSHHAPIPPSPNPPPSESILEPPGDLSPSSFQNRDIVSLFAFVMGEEGLQCGPFFVGPYNALRALRRLERSTFDTERVGGGV